MPFEPVDGFNYSQVALGLRHFFLDAPEAILDHLPAYQPPGAPTAEKASFFVNAAITMFGEAFDKGFEQIADHEVRLKALEGKEADLKQEVAGDELIEGRLDEQVQALGGPPSIPGR
jgi:hypothetical protein